LQSGYCRSEDAEGVARLVIAATLSELKVPIGSVRPYARNPRRGNLDAIRGSLEIHGQYKPIVVNRRTSEVLAGNHTLAAALELGWHEIAVTFVDVDEEQAARIVLVDNRTSDLGSYDEQALVDLLASFEDGLEGTGFVPLELNRLLAGLERERLAGADTDPGDLPTEPRIRLGDVYELGEHRLVCGDSANGAIAKATAGTPVELVWTDPPYGVDYVGKTSDKLTLQGDNATGLSALLADVFAAVTEAAASAGRFYVAAPAGPQGTVFRLAVASAGWRLHQVLVWAKDVFVLGHSDYHYRHEDVLFGYLPGKGRPGRGAHRGSRWYGDNSASTVFEVPRPKRSREHPTMKPVALIEAHLANSSLAGDAVLDPFAGSGSTLIACENLGRRCFAVELEPGYCDVIVDRWQRHTGQTAVQVG
jgi:DNA modification methylase